jgi:hypothetical protein
VAPAGGDVEHVLGAALAAPLEQRLELLAPGVPGALDIVGRARTGLRLDVPSVVRPHVRLRRSAR